MKAKRLLCLGLILLLNLSVFAIRYKSAEGTDEGKHWEIWRDSSIDSEDFIVNGRTVLSGYWHFYVFTFGDKLYIEGTKNKNSKSTIYSMNGNVVIPSGYEYTTKKTFEGFSGEFLEVRKTNGSDLYSSEMKLIKSGFSYYGEKSFVGNEEKFMEFTFKLGDKYESELYNHRWELVLPKYKSMIRVNDQNGNIKYWEIDNSSGYTGLLSSDLKTWIIDFGKQFTDIKEISAGGTKRYICKKGNYWGLYDEKVREIVMPNTFTEMTNTLISTSSYFLCKKNGYWGLYDVNMNEIIAPEYDALSTFEGTNFIKFKLSGFYGVMTLQGRITKTIIPTTRGYTNIGRYVKSQKRFTYEMDGFKGECNHLGQQISKIKVETPKQNTSVASSSSSSSSSTSSSSNNNSGNNTTTIHVEHHRDPVPVQEWVPCSVCGHNPGVCQTCLGSGSGPGRSGRCISCGYSGKCHFCNGQGGRYQTVYR